MRTTKIINKIHHVVWNFFTLFKISEMYCTLLDVLYLEASLHHSLFSKCLAVPLLTAKDVWVFCDLYLRFIPSINLWKKSIFKIHIWQCRFCGYEVNAHSSRTNKYCIFSQILCWDWGCHKNLKNKTIVFFTFFQRLMEGMNRRYLALLVFRVLK